MSRDEVLEAAREAGLEAPRVMILKRRTGEKHFQLYWGAPANRFMLSVAPGTSLESLKSVLEVRGRVGDALTA